jgi:phosphatidylserine/phosphatidylglycerophosphate/cardiolipin synthase-like enzyme
MVGFADAGTPAAKVLVASANFSENAQRHNFEAGWLVRAPWRVDQVHQHFQQLVAEGQQRQLPRIPVDLYAAQEALGARLGGVQRMGRDATAYHKS